MLTLKRTFIGLATALLALIVFLVGIKFKADHDRNERWREAIRQLRAQYPFESLDERLPPSLIFKTKYDLSQAAVESLEKFELSISKESESRESQLKKLHEGTVEEFVQREGFGVARMFGGYADSVFVGRNKTSIAQPSSAFLVPFKEIDSKSDKMPTNSSKLRDLHFGNLLHFANPAGFGFMKDRHMVAGFQAHQFNQLLEEKPWKIMRIELIGLSEGYRPRVYVTETLPRMQDMREVPTRFPDSFESDGLDALALGEELYIRDAANGVRMVGAIRNAQQCIRCHGGERGALIGAFSYGLRREP